MTTSLVTGANRGIGREVSIQLARLGHHVLLGSRTAANATGTADEIAAGGGTATIVELDIADAGSVASAAAQIGAARGLDVLVNNAAITYDTWQRAIDAEMSCARPSRPTSTAPGA